MPSPFPHPDPTPNFPPAKRAGKECDRSLDERASSGAAVAESRLLRSASLLLGFARGEGGHAWAEAPLLSVSAGQYRPRRIDDIISVPDSVQHRLWPDGSGIDNIYLAGDWVRSGVNAGCIEAAVIAGRMVARAITEVDMNIRGNGSSNVSSLPIGALPASQLRRQIEIGRRRQSRVARRILRHDPYPGG